MGRPIHCFEGGVQSDRRITVTLLYLLLLLKINISEAKV
jgi:hypothetical protein